VSGSPRDIPYPHPPVEDCTSCRQNLGAFVLKSLDRFDHGLVEQHLRWCSDCQTELTRHEAIVEGLALGSPDSGELAPGTWATIQSRIAQDEDVAEPVPVAPPSVTRSTPAAPRRNWLPTAVIAPLVIVAIVLGTWGWSLQQDLQSTEAELANHALLNSTLVGAPQVQLYSMEQSCPTCEGVGQIGVSTANSLGMVVGWDFDPQMTHDVWGINHDGERSQVCSLVVAQDGAVMQMFTFPDAPSRFTDIYVTDEVGRLVYQSHITTSDREDPAWTPQS
jgi:hypothetical protein